MNKKEDFKVVGDTLVGFIADALTKGGLRREDARTVGEMMIATDLLGGEGHGIFRLPRYLDRLKAGGFNANPNIRVEKRKGPNGIEYRIVGILWGGTKAVDRLQIRFGKDDPFVPFAVCPVPKTHTMWNLWEYRWKPAQPGTYDIALEVADQSVPQRRLKTGYYMRQVKIEEV